MDDSLNEIKRNLCAVRQFDLAGALGPKSARAEPQGASTKATGKLNSSNCSLLYSGRLA